MLVPDDAWVRELEFEIEVAGSAPLDEVVLDASLVPWLHPAMTATRWRPRSQPRKRWLLLNAVGAVSSDFCVSWALPWLAFCPRFSKGPPRS